MDPVAIHLVIDTSVNFGTLREENQTLNQYIKWIKQQQKKVLFKSRKGTSLHMDISCSYVTSRL